MVHKWFASTSSSSAKRHGGAGLQKSVTTTTLAPCGMLFLRLSQAYKTAAFLFTACRNAGQPWAGEPVTVSTCRSLTASGGIQAKLRKLCHEVLWETPFFFFKKKSIVKMLSYCLQKPRFFMMQKSFVIFMDYTALITKNITWFFGLFTLCLRTSWHHHLFKCWFMK